MMILSLNLVKKGNKMKKRILSKIIGASLIASLMYTSSSFAQEAVPNSTNNNFDFSKMTDQQKQQLGNFVSEYLMENPNILVKMSEKIQAEQQKKAEQERKVMAGMVATDLKDQLINDKDTPTIGNKDAEIALIEFFDYNCVYCSKAAPDVDKIIKANPDMKFIFKEWPIFDTKLPTSDLAARVGFKVLKEKGDEAYYKYHNAVYATKHVEGQLTKDDIVKAAKTVGIDATTLKDNEYQDLIQKNKELADKIKLGGTPSFIIMPTKNANADNTFIYPGILSEKDMQTVINQIKASLNN